MLPRKWRWVAASLALAAGSVTAQAQAPQNATTQPAPAAQPMLQISVNWPRSTPRTGSAPGYVVQGQPAQPGESVPAPRGTAAPQAPAGAPMEAASRPEQLSTVAEALAAEPALGPTPPEKIHLLSDALFGTDCGAPPLLIYGWGDFGYTYSSVGPGLLATETRENRFGNEVLANELAIVVEKALDPTKLSWGFNVTYYAGADAALLQPLGGIDNPPDNPRFSQDFRQLYLSAHLPIITEGGMDVKAGRMGTIIGYESALAPYRPFYSNDYQWFYAEDGAWTGFLTNLHVNKQLDVLNGMTLGANTFFTKRSEDSYCYIGQANYWLTEEKKTLLSGSLYFGENAIFAAPGLNGDFDFTWELRLQHDWSKCLTQIVQSDNGFDQHTPVGTAHWWSAYNIFVYHLTEKIDVGNRVEWFYDVEGTRIGVKGNFSEVTLNADYHPVKYLSIRPELRGDFADHEAFGPGGIPRDRQQLTAAVDVLLKF
jgi:hypothetical protein